MPVDWCFTALRKGWSLQWVLMLWTDVHTMQCYPAVHWIPVPLSVNFINFKKAFDSVCRESRWNMARMYGIQQCNNIYWVFFHMVADCFHKYSLSWCMLFKYISLFECSFLQCNVWWCWCGEVERWSKCKVMKCRCLYTVREAWDFLPSFSLMLIGPAVSYAGVCT